MRRKTTTRQIADAISNNLLSIQKAEIYYKSSRETETIEADEFKDNLDYLCESGCFADFVDWYYERNLSEKDGYILDSGAKNPCSENIITVYLHVGEDASVEDIETILEIGEE